jgi:dTDP-4-dehydrorhamnose 3,5-epimerase
MKFKETKLKGAYIIELSTISDDRGVFMRTYCKDEFKAIGFEKEFVQFNQSINYKKGTLRGMHYQIPPFAECKLIRCISGAVLDVIVDIRNASSTFLQWHAEVLTENNYKMVFIPEGFAHGFLTLEDNSNLMYHHTSFYNKESDRGILYNDALLAIRWPNNVGIISQKDKSYTVLDNNFKGIKI